MRAALIIPWKNRLFRPTPPVDELPARIATRIRAQEEASEILYVFIFIALRTLNFDARKVVIAGVVAVVGWILLVAYVIMFDPRDSMITHDYVRYMTSNSVLIGAEVDKVISILGSPRSLVSPAGAICACSPSPSPRARPTRTSPASSRPKSPIS